MALPPPKRRSLTETARTFLDNDPRNSYEIARLTGVSYFWLRKFRKGQILNPGVQNIELLLTAYDVG